MKPLSKWFHDDRPAVWSKLAHELGAHYTAGTWKSAARIQVRHGEWTMTLDTFTIVVGNVPMLFTRFRAPFTAERPFRMKLVRKSVFTGVAKFLGMQDIEVGDAAFDQAFVIKSNDESAVRAFLSDEGLREAIAREPGLTLSVEDDEGWFGRKFPREVDELRVVIPGHKADIERLRRLFELFADALDQLCRAELALPRSPGLEL